MDLNWKRVLTKSEESMENCPMEKQMITCYVLTLSSLKELQRKQFENVLIDLIKKVPTLRLRITKRQDELWFKEVKDNIIDFETRKGGSCETLIKEVLTHVYKSDTNPLWIARLLWNNHPLTEEGYRYKLLLGFHHSISDGYSNIRIAKLLLQLLNNELGGQFDTEEQLGIHATDVQSKEIVNIFKTQVAQEIDDGLSITEILNVKPAEVFQIFKPPIDGENCTNTMTVGIGCEETSKFISLCRFHKISFNSAFSTIINITIANILLETWMDKDSYEISSLHTVNLRRYWKTSSEIQLGTHARFMPITAVILKKNLNDIWHCAKEFYTLFTSLIDLKAVYKVNAYCDVMNTSRSKIFPFYYTTSNMGCVDSCLGLEFPYVNAIGIERHASCRKSQTVSHLLQTLNGRFVHSLDYNANMVAKEAASWYCERIFETFRYSLVN